MSESKQEDRGVLDPAVLVKDARTEIVNLQQKRRTHWAATLMDRLCAYVESAEAEKSAKKTVKAAIPATRGKKEKRDGGEA